MTKQLYVADLQEGMSLEGERFLLLNKSTSVARNGKPYLALTVGDRTGRIPARYWDVPEDVPARLEVGEGLLLSARVTTWQNALQLTVTSAEPCAAEPLEELMIAGPRPVAEMVEELRGVIAGVAEPWLRALLEQLLLDPGFLPRYSSAPAAKRNHHAWVGGLLAHSLAVARGAQFVAGQYPQADRDLLVSAALLHDVGKVEAYTARPGLDFTDEGRLLGHVVLGALMVEGAIAGISGFPGDLRVRLLHAILAHHGSLERGSPVAPKTLEAVLLHYLDWLDGQAQAVIDHLEQQPAGESAWTSRCPMLGVELFRGSPTKVENGLA